MGGIGNHQVELLMMGMADEFTSHHGPHPGPVAFGGVLAEWMPTKPPPCRIYSCNDFFLCFVVENLIVGVGKDEDIIFLEVFRCESSRIGDGGGGHTQLPADLLQGHNDGRDILVDISFAVFRVDKGTFPFYTRFLGISNSPIVSIPAVSIIIRKIFFMALFCLDHGLIGSIATNGGRAKAFHNISASFGVRSLSKIYNLYFNV